MKLLKLLLNHSKQILPNKGILLNGVLIPKLVNNPAASCFW